MADVVAKEGVAEHHADVAARADAVAGHKPHDDHIRVHNDDNGHDNNGQADGAVAVLTGAEDVLADAEAAG